MSAVEQCTRCQREIQRDQEAFIWQDQVLCQPCYAAATAPAAAPAPASKGKGYALGRFIRRRPKMVAAVALLLIGTWAIWWFLFAPVKVEHPQTALLGDVEVGIWSVHDYERADATLFLTVQNHSFDKKLDLNFDAVKVFDEAGNQYAVQEVVGKYGAQQSKESLYPGYRLKQPLVLQRLLHKDLYVHIGSDFCEGARRAIFHIDTFQIDRYQNSFSIKPIDWTRAHRVHVGVQRTLTVRFTRDGDKIIAKGHITPGKPNNSFGQGAIAALDLYLYDKDGKMTASGYAPDFRSITGEFEFFIFNQEKFEADSFRVDWTEY